MTLNRNAMWTLNDGTKIPVKNMTLEHLDQAIYYVDQCQLEESSYDPYIISQICENSDCCQLPVEPEHKKDGFFLDDWHVIFINEMLRRFKTLQTGLLPIRNVAKKQFWLVKWFKFW